MGMERIHIFKQGQPKRPTLLLLHGTGGSEKNLIEIAAKIDPTASLLSLRGEVIENGQTRHFRRLAPGIFDEKDLVKRTDDLAVFIDWAAHVYALDRSRIVAFGYSNGANLAASHLLRFPHSLAGAILLHPLSAGQIDKLPAIENTPVFIGAGTDDPLCPLESTKRLTEQLKKAGAAVELNWFSHGHMLSSGELSAAADWYKRHY